MDQAKRKQRWKLLVCDAVSAIEFCGMTNDGWEIIETDILPDVGVIYTLELEDCHEVIV